MPTSPAIEMVELTKDFGKVRALDTLTLDIERGEVFGFLGPNGAGKSTTIRLLLGLISPTAGAAKVMGENVRNVASHKHVAYVPGETALWPKLTGTECLELMGNLHGQVDKKYRDELIERFQLDVSKRSRAYSKGNRQKVVLIAALASRADVLLLDEPTGGLDPLMEREFRHCIHEATEHGQTVFLSSHILGEVERLCNRVGILRSGCLVEVATIDQLREMRSTELEIDFDDTPPDLTNVTGVSKVEVTGYSVHVWMTGSPKPLLRALENTDVHAIHSREASLEEIFLAYYGESSTR